MERLPHAFYNIQVSRDLDRVMRELGAVANNVNHDPARRRPKVLGGCEGEGYDLRELDRYDLLHSHANPSRENVFLYVLKRLDRGPVEYWDGDRTWPRVDHPGTHPARSTLWVPVEGVLVGAGHAPQGLKGAPRDSIGPLELARKEWLDEHAQKLNDHQGPFVFLCDPNGLAVELRSRVRNSVMAGTPVEAILTRGYTITYNATPNVVNHVRMMSDHHRCLMGRLNQR